MGLTPPPYSQRPWDPSISNSGYSGRAGIYEVIVDREIQELIFAGSLHRLIEDAATKAGTSLMLGRD